MHQDISLNKMVGKMFELWADSWYGNSQMFDDPTWEIPTYCSDGNTYR